MTVLRTQTGIRHAKKEIKAVVFYQEDLDELRKIKREIERIVWDDFCKNKGEDCKTVGIMFFAD